MYFYCFAVCPSYSKLLLSCFTTSFIVFTVLAVNKCQENSNHCPSVCLIIALWGKYLYQFLRLLSKDTFWKCNFQLKCIFQ